VSTFFGGVARASRRWVGDITVPGARQSTPPQSSDWKYCHIYGKLMFAASRSQVEMRKPNIDAAHLTFTPHFFFLPKSIRCKTFLLLFRVFAVNLHPKVGASSSNSSGSGGDGACIPKSKHTTASSHHKNAQRHKFCWMVAFTVYIGEHTHTHTHTHTRAYKSCLFYRLRRESST
jgi:hypothetical protein